MSIVKKTIIISLAFLSMIFSLSGQIRFDIATINNPSPGYLFCASDSYDKITYFDNNGDMAYAQQITVEGRGYINVMVLDNYITCFSAVLDRWLVMDKSFNILDTVGAPYPLSTDFHDFIIAPNGHYFVLSRGMVDVDMSLLIDEGKPNATIVNYCIHEFDQNKVLLHTWNALDHYNILDATSENNLRDVTINPFHINSMYLDNDGNLIISARHQDEISKINMTTGQFVWRMGGTACRNNQFTFVNDTYQNFTGFSHQHNVHRLSNGNLLCFDNGNMKPTPYSRAVEYELNETTKTITKVWSYTNSPSIFSTSMGNAQRLPNGNTLIGWGSSQNGDIGVVIATEVDQNGNKVFEMTNPTISTYRVIRSVYNMASKTLNVASTGNYDFSDANNNTNIKLNINSLSGSGSVWVEKHNYAAKNLTYQGKPACINVPYRWTVYKKGITGISGRILLSLATFTDLIDKEQVKIYHRDREGSGNFNMLNNCNFDESTNSVIGDFAGIGEYIISYSNNYPQVPLTPANYSTNQSIKPYFTWEKILEEDIHTLEISSDSLFQNIVFDTLDIRTNKFQYNANLLNYTKYYWHIKNTNLMCESEWSETFSFTTLVSNPTQIFPQNDAKDIAFDGKLLWSAVSGGEVYRVQLSENEDFKINVVDVNLVNLLEYGYKNLKSATLYYWRVCASNKGVFGNWSSTFSFRTNLKSVTLSNPLNTIGGVPANGLLNWVKLPDATIYRVQVAKDTNFYKPVIDQAGLDTNQFKYSDLENYTSYYWRVRAGNDESKGEWSDVWNFRTEVATPYQINPSNNATNVSPVATLNWDAVSNAMNYEIILSDKSDLSNPIISSVTPKTSIKTPTLGFEKVYYWKVRAKDSKYFGQWSEVKNFKIQPENVLVSPNTDYPPDKSYKVSVSPVLTWEDVFNATNYEIHLSTKSNFSDTVVYENLTNVIELSVDNLDFNTTYYWRSRASNSKAVSGWSETKSFTTKLIMPTLLTPDNEVTEMPSALKLIWNSTEGAEFYYLQVSKDAEFDQVIEDRDNLSSTLFSIDNLESNTNYFWRVKSLSSVNESDWSTVFKFTVKLYSGVNTLTELEDLIMYPNPATDFIEIKSTIPVSNFRLFDLSGNIVLNSDNSKRIILDGIVSGVYNYLISFGDKVIPGRLVIVR